MTVGDYYKEFISRLNDIYEDREARTIADWVFENITGSKTLQRISEPKKELKVEIIQQLDRVLEKLLDHIPVQYVLNEVWFYKMKFFVNEHVLIPRPETEELVEWSLEEIRNKELEIRNKEVLKPLHNSMLLTPGPSLTTHNSQLTILDIGSGSGCIAIALKKELSGSKIISIDISEEALKVANQNSHLHNTMIQFVQCDFLDETKWIQFPQFDIIISNPPYIPASEKEKLSKNVAKYEPYIALFVTENDPLIFYKKIAKFSEQYLKSSGNIFVEVHEDYAKEVAKIFEANRLIVNVRKDIFGKERMIKAVLSS